MKEKLKELRARKKMTQEDLAAASGVSRATIAAIESGATESTTVGTVKKLAEALGTTPSNLLR